MRILLYRSGALGDTLLILPALDTLREKFPGARLHLAAHPPYAAPLLDAGRADTAAGAGAKSILDAGSPPFHLLHQESRPDFPDDLTKLFSGFDLIALFTNDPDGAAARRLDSVPERGSAAARTATRGIVAPPFPPEGDEGHVSEWMVRALAPLSVKPPADPPPPLLPLAPSPEIRAGAAKLIGEFSLAPKKFLAIHPGGGGRGKWPPVGTLLEIAENFCREAGAQILLIEGPADSEPCETFRRAWRKPLAQIKSPRLDHLAGVLTEAAAYLGGDSGISHLAALCGAPTLAMFGPESEPDAWAPIGERAEWMKWDEGDGAARLMALAGKPD